MKKIALLPGDGIGPEITKEAVLLMEEVGAVIGETFQFQEGAIGGGAVDRYGTPLPEETIRLCQNSDAILMGAVGGPKWDRLPGHLRPETGLLGIRKVLNVFANLRPVHLFPSLSSSSPLKEERVKGLDLMIVRELTGGIYFGRPKERRTVEGKEVAVDTLTYTEDEIERILHVAFTLARKRKKEVLSIDKANVLESSRLWREKAEQVALAYPDVTLTHLLVDSAAMQLVLRPNAFDVIVTENMFGDILSDLGGALAGSLGMLPSASLSENGPSLYEPVHGSAPDIAGKGIANPVAMFLTVSMMMELSFGFTEVSRWINQAVEEALDEGYRTKDLTVGHEKWVGTEEMGRVIREKFRTLAKGERNG
ncbi:3-isopropylmalate dehydrogenase [[Clostridium] ultunense Esp]|nr:3-isopropylmalate dehydrogenase [[Clostridium] ultunense Esp]